MPASGPAGAAPRQGGASPTRSPAVTPLVWQIAWRYIRGRGSQMLASTARAALLATTLGVMAMVIAMALMTGYTEDLQRKLVGLQTEIVAQPLTHEAFDDHAATLLQVANWPEVARTGRAAYGEGALSSQAQPSGLSVALKGIEADGDLSFGDTRGLLPDDRGVSGALLGAELANRLGVQDGDVLRLVVLGAGDSRVRFRYQSLRMAGSFTTGFAEYDSGWLVIERSLLEKLRGSGGINVLEIELVDPAQTDTMAERLEAVLGPDFVVSNWQRINRQLFTALKLQQLALFLVLGLIVVVSTFNVSSTLVILVRERMKDIGLLGALGLQERQLRRIFTLYGLLLGALGIALGVGIGGSICWLLTTFEVVRFPPEIAEIYFIDSVPFRLRLVDLLAIIGFSLLMTFLACLLPARRAARLEPAEALRYE